MYLVNTASPAKVPRRARTRYASVLGCNHRNGFSVVLPRWDGRLRAAFKRAT